MEVSPLTTAIGAEIRGVDLAELDDSTVDAIRKVWLEHCVVFFRDQSLTPKQQLALAERFGEVVPPPVDSGVQQPEPGVLVLDQVSPVGAGTDRWHADSTFLPNPPMGAILYAVELPAVGGDTLFASMYAAYESLSEPLRTMLDGLTAVHSSRTVDEIMGVERIAQSTTHPVVRTHPETGRKALFVNGNWTTRIRELGLDESDHVLALLFDHVKSPMLQCRFRWTPGAVAFWDNRAVQHFASPDYDERRLMHRVLLAG
jgi:alpha-ketoglutarate-dependent taurine dioxygenase